MLLGYIVFALIVSFAGLNRKIGYWKTLLWSLLLSPFVGLFVAMNSGCLDARGCRHCGNKDNEAEFCGICKKNEAGLTREEVAQPHTK